MSVSDHSLTYTLVANPIQSSATVPNLILVDSGPLHDLIQLLDGQQLHLYHCSFSDTRLSGSIDSKIASVLALPGLTHLCLDLDIDRQPGLPNFKASTFVIRALYDVYQNGSQWIPIYGNEEIVTPHLVTSDAGIPIGNQVIVFRFSDDWDFNPQYWRSSPNNNSTLASLAHCQFQHAKILKDSVLVCVPLLRNLLYICLHVEVQDYQVTPNINIQGYRVQEYRHPETLIQIARVQFSLGVVTRQGVLSLRAEAQAPADPHKIRLHVDLITLNIEEIHWLEEILWQYIHPDVRLNPQSGLHLEWDCDLQSLTDLTVQLQVRIRAGQNLNLTHTVRPYEKTQMMRSELCRILGCPVNRLHGAESMSLGLSISETNYDIKADVCSKIKINRRLTLQYLGVQIVKSQEDSHAQIEFSGDLSLGSKVKIEMLGQYDYVSGRIWMEGTMDHISFRKWIRKILINKERSDLVERFSFSMLSMLEFQIELLKGDVQVKALSLVYQGDSSSSSSSNDENEDDKQPEPEELNDEERHDQERDDLEVIEDHSFIMTYIYQLEKDSEEIRFQCRESKRHECDLKRIFPGPEVEIFESTKEARISTSGQRK